jgi:hypothetical protein
MPSLASLNINRTPVHSPPAAGGYHPEQQRPAGYFQPVPPASSQSVQQQQPGPEMHIQSWAGSNVEQPKPMPPMQGFGGSQGRMWTPDMGIKFGAPPGPPGGSDASQGGNPPVGGKWEAGSGIRFG